MKEKLNFSISKMNAKTVALFRKKKKKKIIMISVLLKFEFFYIPLDYTLI